MSSVNSTENLCETLKPHTKEMIIECLKSKVKNPVSILDELRQPVEYVELEPVLSKYGWIFSTLVFFNDNEFIGEGWSKPKAKSKAAEKALKDLVQYSEPDDEYCNSLNKLNETPKNPSVNAVMVLNSLYPQEVDYIIELNSNEMSDKFKVTIHVEGYTFYGLGPSKKKAKHAAALEALTALSVFHSKHKILVQTLRNCSAPLDKLIFADRVRNIIYNKFIDLANINPSILKRKVLAGFVMTKDESMDDITVICVATGTKCINGGNICGNGEEINDMHAEIVARRCLIDYLYDQLDLLFIKGEDDKSIFVRGRNDKICELKGGIKFHLYVSTTPCGATNLPCLSEDPDNVSRIRLRAKKESVTGTVPIKDDDVIQTWDGILLGGKLLTMSCSDKIARWNVLGLQGSLLSLLVDPIYLSSVILGRNNVQESHVQRALFGRVEESLSGLPTPFRLNKPGVYFTSSQDVRCTNKAPNFSANWNVGQVGPEIIDTATGRTELGPSRLSKHNFFKRFSKLAIYKPNDVDRTYSGLKCEAEDYDKTKKELFKAFADAGMGTWVKKPEEEDQFEL